MDELKKRLKEIRDRIDAYKALSIEARTDELKTQVDADTEELKTVLEDIKREERLIAIDADLNQTINDRNAPDLDNDFPNDSKIEIDDAPTYRGQFALGQQMVDIITAAKPNIREVDPTGYQRATSRLASAAKRESELRAAGTGGQVEAINADGGFLLQGETSQDLFTKGFNNSAILPRTANRTMSSSYVSIIGINEDSRADGSRGGGVRVYTTGELDQMTQSKTTFKYIRVEPQKFTGMYFASDEILKDAPFLTGEMNGLFGEEFAFKMQDQIINGSGAAGEMMGIVNANCRVNIAKETDQAADTIKLANIQKMRMRLWGGCRNPVWVTNQNTSMQLQNLSLSIGTGGALVPLYRPASGPTETATLDGLPVLVIEQAAGLGDKDDIMLVDFGQYIYADKGSMVSASSIHLKFDYNQTTFRYIYYADGQPRWESALTPYKGTADTVSPIVGLAERA